MMPLPPGHESFWAASLLALLEKMATQDTNAVLLLFADLDHIEPECRYPDDGIQFADKHWRAFYHRHRSNPMHPDEHGHFHLFTDTGEQTWAHVAGLSIDYQGMPLQWFMVNRWVTDGAWLKRELFYDQLQYIPDNDDACLTGRWLGIMLQLYHANLFSLLKERDIKLERSMLTASQQDPVDNRDIYMLAEQQIELQHMLEMNLSGNKAEQRTARGFL